MDSITRGTFGLVDFPDDIFDDGKEQINLSPRAAVVVHVFEDGRLLVHYSGNSRFYAVIPPTMLQVTREGYFCEGSVVDPEWDGDSARCTNYWVEDIDRTDAEVWQNLTSMSREENGWPFDFKYYLYNDPSKVACHVQLLKSAEKSGTYLSGKPTDPEQAKGWDEWRSRRARLLESNADKNNDDPEAVYCKTCDHFVKGVMWYFGACPKCHDTDGYIKVGSDHWFLCIEHKIRWFVGSNLFSSWEEQTEEKQKEICDVLDFSSFEVVDSHDTYDIKGLGSVVLVKQYQPEGEGSPERETFGPDDPEKESGGSPL